MEFIRWLMGFSQEEKKEPWLIAAARYCVEHAEKGIEEQELVKFIQSQYSISPRYIGQFINEELAQPTGRAYSRSPIEGSWFPPLDLVTKVVDFDELKEARKNSSQAFKFSVFAIIISLASLILAMVQTFFIK